MLKHLGGGRVIDMGPAQNAFHVGSGVRRRQAYSVATRLYGNHSKRRREPEFVALIAAIAGQAIADARSGKFATKDIVSMSPAFRFATGLPEDANVDLEDVASWLRADAEAWLEDFGIVQEKVDERELADAKNHLLSELQREPQIRKVA